MHNDTHLLAAVYLNNVLVEAAPPPIKIPGTGIEVGNKSSQEKQDVTDTRSELEKKKRESDFLPWFVEYKKNNPWSAFAVQVVDPISIFSWDDISDAWYNLQTDENYGPAEKPLEWVVFILTLIAAIPWWVPIFDVVSIPAKFLLRGSSKVAPDALAKGIVTVSQFAKTPAFKTLFIDSLKKLGASDETTAAAIKWLDNMSDDQIAKILSEKVAKDGGVDLNKLSEKELQGFLNKDKTAIESQFKIANKIANELGDAGLTALRNSPQIISDNGIIGIAKFMFSKAAGTDIGTEGTIKKLIEGNWEGLFNFLSKSSDEQIEAINKIEDIWVSLQKQYPPLANQTLEEFFKALYPEIARKTSIFTDDALKLGIETSEEAFEKAAKEAADAIAKKAGSTTIKLTDEKIKKINDLLEFLNVSSKSTDETLEIANKILKDGGEVLRGAILKITSKGGIETAEKFLTDAEIKALEAAEKIIAKESDLIAKALAKRGAAKGAEEVATSLIPGGKAATTVAKHLVKRSPFYSLLATKTLFAPLSLWLSKQYKRGKESLEKGKPQTQQIQNVWLNKPYTSVTTGPYNTNNIPKGVPLNNIQNKSTNLGPYQVNTTKGPRLATRGTPGAISVRPK